MKTTILAIAAMAAISGSVNAADDILKLTMNDGTVHTFNVGDIKEMNFEVEENSLSGNYTGGLTAHIGDNFHYDTAEDVVYTVTEEADGTLTVYVPTFKLSGTVMGNLTVGGYQVKGLAFDTASGSYVKVYGGDGQTLHFTAEGAMAMDGDYAFKENCKLTLIKTEGGISVKNEFQMGTMPFLITTEFEGSK